VRGLVSVVWVGGCGRIGRIGNGMRCLIVGTFEIGWRCGHHHRKIRGRSAVVVVFAPKLVHLYSE
jgi:hypothetical protein